MRVKAVGKYKSRDCSTLTSPLVQSRYGLPLGRLRCGCTGDAGDREFCGFLTVGKQFNKIAAGLADRYLYCICRTDGLKPLRVLSNEPSIMLLYPQLLNYMSRISLLECLRH